MTKKHFEVEIPYQNFIFLTEEDAEDFYFAIKSVRKDIDVSLIEVKEEE